MVRMITTLRGLLLKFAEGMHLLRAYFGVVRHDGARRSVKCKYLRAALLPKR
jgi:hypothetical protein